MKVSLNILLDSIRDFSLDFHIDNSIDLAFDAVTLIPDDGSTLQTSRLYVGRLSDFLELDSAQKCPENRFVLLRNCVANEQETEENLSGAIIVNENISFVRLFSLLHDKHQAICQQREEHQSSDAHLHDSLFAGLIEGGLNEDALIRQRAEALDIPYAGKFAIFNIRVTEGQNYSIDHLSQELCDLFANAKTLLYHQQIILMENLDVEDSELKLRHDIDVLNNFLERYNLYCGVSTPFHTLSEFQNAYHQSIAAKRYIDRVNNGKLFELPDTETLLASTETTRVFTFDRTFIHSMLDSSAQTISLWRNSVYGKNLLALHRYDTQHNTNNLALLYTYLNCERSIKETGDIMHLHRNTVIYRIAKINEIINIDLDNPFHRLRLLISYYMLRICGLNELN